MSKSMIVVLSVAALALGAPGCAPPEEPAEEAEPADAADTGEMSEDVAAPDAVETGDMAMGHSTVAPATSDTVTVNVTCPNAQGKGALTVSVNPLLYERQFHQDSRWVLSISGSNNNSVEVRKKSGEEWGFTQDSYDDPNGNLTVPGDQMKDVTDAYRYGYDVVVSCGSSEIVLDPEMEIRP